MGSVTAIIVTYNNAATIAACLKAVQEAGVEKIVVVDNNSTDDSAAISSSHDATVMQNTQNLGFATAANQGAEKAQTPYLLFLNPDTQPHPAAVSQAATYLKEHPPVAIVGLALTDPKTGHIEQLSFGKFPTLWHIFARKLFPLPPVKKKEAMPVDWVSGGALLIRQHAWRQVKGFDPNFFLYWEDIDLCRRVKQNGHRIVVLPTATCFHQRGASLINRQHKAQLYDAGADRYFRKHYPSVIWGIQHYLRRLYRLVQPYSQ